MIVANCEDSHCTSTKTENGARVGVLETGWEDYQHWLETDLKQVRRSNQLIREIMHAPLRYNY